MAQRILVVATGTEVGKTHVAGALLAALRATQRVIGLKPIESGGDADARALSAAAGIAVAPLYALGAPVSPHLAAAREGRAIEVARVVAWVHEREHELSSRITVIETAGGLFSPLGPGLTNASLAVALAPAVMILVAPDRLGVLHDVTATLEAWRACSRLGSTPPPRELVVLSSPPEPDASTATNGAELAALGIARVAATFPRAAHDALATQAVARALAQRVTEATNAFS